MTRPLLVLAFLLALAGCAVPVTVTPQSTGASERVTDVSSEDAVPVAVRIPRVAAASGLIPLGLNPDGTLAVPSAAAQASWYRDGNAGVIPGQDGPALILGHINYQGQPGIFNRLHELRIGDKIEIGTADGSTLTFAVYRSAEFAKDAFPWAHVAGDVDRPEVRLITCSGTFREDVRSYSENLVIYAHLV